MTGLRTVGRAWAAWLPSAGFYRTERHKELEFDTLGDLSVGHWEAMFKGFDANDVLAQIAVWQASDIGARSRYGRSFEKALAAITAKAIVMPCATDAYFP